MIIYVVFTEIKFFYISQPEILVCHHFAKLNYVTYIHVYMYVLTYEHMHT